MNVLDEIEAELKQGCYATTDWASFKAADELRRERLAALCKYVRAAELVFESRTIRLAAGETLGAFLAKRGQQRDALQAARRNLGLGLEGKESK